MEQLDLLGVFESSSGDAAPLDRPALVERLTAISARPRFAFFVLDLIAKASGASGSVGPYVVEDDQALPVRDWLCDAIIAVSGREPKRLAVAAQVRRDLDRRAVLPRDPSAAQAMIDTKFGGGCDSPAGLTSAARCPISSVPASSAAIIRAMPSTITTAAPSARRSIRSPTSRAALSRTPLSDYTPLWRHNFAGLSPKRARNERLKWLRSTKPDKLVVSSSWRARSSLSAMTKSIGVVPVASLKALAHEKRFIPIGSASRATL